MQVIADSTEYDWTPKYNPWLMAIPLMGAAFLFMLDETIANVALPHMAGSFSISHEESMWILTSYLIASGIVIPSVDFFCKLLGRTKFFMLCVLLFTTASLLCGLSTSIEMMLLARILQGLGGGGLIPIAQAIMLESFPIEKRGQSIAAFGLVVVIAPIIGPVLGGWLTENLSWPYIYFINIPIGLFSLALAKIFLEDPPYLKKQDNVKIDKFGFFYLTGWLVTFQIFLDKGNNADWFNAPWICWTFTFSVIFFLLFIFSQLTQKDPLCDLRVFKDRNFGVGTLTQMIMQGVLLASLAILPQFLQLLMGYDSYQSGLSITPRGIGALISIFLYGTLSTKIDNRLMITVGLILLGVAGWQLGTINLQISQINIAIPNILYGLGAGFSMIPIITLSSITLNNDQMTNASGLQNLSKNLGGAIGTSIVGTFVSRFSQIHQHYLVDNLNPLNPNFMARINAAASFLAQRADNVSANFMANFLMYKQLLQQSALYAYVDAFRVFAIACFLLVPLMLLMKSKK